jgi:hypothetical protein
MITQILNGGASEAQLFYAPVLRTIPALEKSKALLLDKIQALSADLPLLVCIYRFDVPQQLVLIVIGAAMT